MEPGNLRHFWPYKSVILGRVKGFKNTLILGRWFLWVIVHIFLDFNFASRSDLWKIGEVKADMLPKSSALESRHNMPNPKKLQNEDFWKSPKEIVKKSQGIFSIFKKSIFREIGGPSQSQKGPPAPWNLGKISFLKTGDIPLRKQHISQWSDRFFSFRSFFQKIIKKSFRKRIYKGGIASGKGSGPKLWIYGQFSQFGAFFRKPP